MPPEPRAHNLALMAAAMLFAGGCTLMPKPEPDAPPAIPIARPDPSLAIVAEHLQTMAALNQGTPVQQAEIAKTVRDEAQLQPTTSHLLRYALVLATPDHGASDPVAARERLSALLASPEKLLPAERSLAAVFLDHVNKRLVLQAENQKLQADGARSERERGAATNRRLQAEIEENARLRKALKEAQDKLDEIARIERQIIDRKPTNGTR
ncbi:MAG TPA: hypothetical protein VFR59_08235 [Steroidobacteraceae bacterium]|nr:hypothetical protein [Steroidobacteraceae bacterium]